MSANNTTADNSYSSRAQPAAQHKEGGLMNKVGGLGNIIHGTGVIINGHIPGAADSVPGGKASMIAAGRQKVERGLDRIEGKPTAALTSSAGRAPTRDWDRGGASDGTGAAAPQTSTGASRADPTTQKARGDESYIRRPVATEVPPRDYPSAADGPGAQRDTDVGQQFQGNGTASSDRDKRTRTADVSDPRVNTADGQEQPFVTAPQA